MMRIRLNRASDRCHSPIGSGCCQTFNREGHEGREEKYKIGPIHAALCVLCGSSMIHPRGQGRPSSRRHSAHTAPEKMEKLLAFITKIPVISER
jgi:hypothetical protein